MENKMRKGILVIFFILLGLIVFTANITAQDEPTADEEGAWFFGFGFVMCLVLFLVIPIIIMIIACVWIYRDANERGMSGGL